MAKDVLPRWIQRCEIIGRSTVDLATRGLNLILDAALVDGMYWRKSDSRLQAPRWPWGRLPGMVARLDVPTAAVVGPVEDYMRTYERKLGFELSPVMRLMKSMPGPELYRLKELCVGELFRSFERFRLLQHEISIDDLRRISATITEYFDPTEVAQSIRPSPPFEQHCLWCMRLDRLLVGATRALMGGGCEPGLLRTDIDSLVLIGAAAIGLSVVVPCEICGRWSLPAHALCAQHSLSAEAGSTKNERQARYEHGLLVRGKLGAEVRRDSRLLDGLPLPSVLAHLLWRSPFKGDHVLCELAREQAASLPGFAELLCAEPADIRAGAIVDLLRKSWDPLQINPFYWPLAVVDAWTWGAAEADLSAPDLRRWNSTNVSIQRATEYAEDHQGCTVTEIATHLDIARSTISSWLIRRNDDSEVSRLKCALATRPSPHFRSPASRPGQRSTQC